MTYQTLQVPTDRVTSNPWQTRQTVDQEHIVQLAADISTNGLLQPALGRIMLHGKPVLDYHSGSYAVLIDEPGASVQLAFGHNRLAAIRLLAGSDPERWSRIRVELRVLTDEQMADYAWSENERRQAHNPIDRALAIQKRLDDFRWTQEQAAQHLQISRSAVANSLRLLKLPADLREHAQAGRLSERQAVALVSLFDLDPEIREKAEAGALFDLRPSTIIQAALDGVSSDNLRRDIGRIPTIYEKTNLFSGLVESPPASPAVVIPAPASTVTPAVAPAPPPNPEPAKSAPTPAPAPAPLPKPVATEPSPATKTAAAPSPAPTPAPAQPPRPEPQPPASASAPLSWDESTIVATITWWPATNGSGRQVMVGMRLNQGAPVMRICQEAEILLEGLLADLLIDLRTSFENSSK